MNTQKSILRFSDVSVSLGDHLLLDSVSFHLQPGEMVYLTGRTGMGKSTLLRLIYADLRPDRGAVEVDQFQLQALKRKDIPYLRRQLGIVFQDFQLLPDRSVADNLRFAMRATGWKDTFKMEGRLAELLAQVGLPKQAKLMPHQLSGGEQQRVAIARALVNQPALLLADEPTGNLDPDATEKIMSLLQQIVKQGTTVFMATHDYGLLRDYPGRVLWLQQGSLQEFGTAPDFLRAFQERETENG